MKYVFTKSQKRMQENLLIQLWRCTVLSLKFMKLTKIDYSRPNTLQKKLEPKPTPHPIGQTRESRG